MIETRAPGKLFIAGEYAVVDPGEPAVLVAVDRCIVVRLEELEQSAAQAAALEGASPHVRAAILATEQLREQRGIASRRYALHIESELDDADGRKLGLGSSAAVTVAVIAALDELYDLRLTVEQRFRLALLATIEVSPRASGGDLAASAFGGWIRYTSPDREALRADRAAHGIGPALESAAWRDCTVTALPAPRTARLLVGWTGSPASTERLVEQLRDGQRPGSAQQLAEQHAAFLAESRSCVDALVAALEQDETRAPEALHRARRALQRLARSSGVEIETERLRALCDIAERHGAAAKPSGAGGGDCGIVLAGPESDVPAVLREWKAAGIEHLDLAVHPAEGGADER